MKVFLSSVRRGLEEERDSLPGLIKALGLEVVRFEDFTALPVPPRQACLDAVEHSDVYLLLLGAHYGERMPDTTLAPTEEEFNAAARKGIPIIVMRRQGVDTDTQQTAFVKKVEAYGSGRFRDSFGNQMELATKVAAALKALQGTPKALKFLGVDPELPVPWLSDSREGLVSNSQSAILEVHLVDVEKTPISAQRLEEARTSLVRIGRDLGVFTPEAAVTPGGTASSAWAVQAGPRAALSGVRLDRSGAVSVWRELPRDNMGSVVSIGSLTDAIANLLRAGARFTTPGVMACVAGVTNTLMLVEGDPANLGRRSSVSLSASAIPSARHEIRLQPELGVNSADVDLGALDISRELATQLIHHIR